jgi:peptidoglycan hydrolase-like protein with peptidoglycan-binding domain
LPLDGHYVFESDERLPIITHLNPPGDCYRKAEISQENRKMSNTVQVLQGRLIALGYDLGPSGADGNLWRKTTAASAKFLSAMPAIEWPEPF